MQTQIQVGRTRLVFGRETAMSVAEEVKQYKAYHPLLVTDQSLNRLGLLDGVKESLKRAGMDWVIYEGVTPDPVSASVDEAVSILKAEKCDAVIGVGGGSVMDTAKCVAAMAVNEGVLLDYDHANPVYKEFEEESLPLINIPTTAGTGSELSPYAVITNEKEGRKATIGSPMLYSRSALVDPAMTLGLPRGATAATGADALAHSIEAYTSVKSMQMPNLFIDALACQALRCLYEALPKACENGMDYQAREKVMWGSTIGGFVLQHGSGAAHGLGNVLGGTVHVPHGNAVGMLLPHVIEFNLDVCAERYAQLARAVGLEGDKENILAEKFAKAMKQLFDKLALPSLSHWLPDVKRISQLAELAVKDKCTRINGKSLTIEDAKNIYKKAYEEKGEAD